MDNLDIMSMLDANRDDQSVTALATSTYPHLRIQIHIQRFDNGKHLFTCLIRPGQMIYDNLSSVPNVTIVCFQRGRQSEWKITSEIIIVMSGLKAYLA